MCVCIFSKLVLDGLRLCPMIAADVNAYWALGHHAAHFEWSDKTLCMGHGSNKGGKGKRNRSMWSRPDLPCVMLTGHWVATHIIASVSDQPYGRRYSVFSCKSNCISCTLVGPCAHWTWASILETSSWLSSRSPHTSLVFFSDQTTGWQNPMGRHYDVWESLSVFYFQHLL